jgi:hypothetical protein
VANILINDLNVPGFDLLSGEESYLNEINDNELNLTYGGWFGAIVGAFALTIASSIATRIIHDHNKGIIARL